MTLNKFQMITLITKKHTKTLKLTLLIIKNIKNILKLNQEEEDQMVDYKNTYKMIEKFYHLTFTGMIPAQKDN